MFRKLDLWILDSVFEPGYQALFMRFGISNFAIAKSFLMLATMLIIIDSLYKGDWEATILIILLIIPCIYACYIEENRWANPRSDQLPENFRDSDHEGVMLRKVILFVILFDASANIFFHLSPPSAKDFVSFVLQELTFSLLLTGLYFLGCTPPGPRDHSKREELQMRKRGIVRQSTK